MIDLLKAGVHLSHKADEWGHYGYVQIRNGKTEFRKRSLPVTIRAKQILTTWMAKSKGDRVFTREDGLSPVSAYTLIQQQKGMRQLLNLPWDACVHSARHTALTNLGLTGVDLLDGLTKLSPTARKAQNAAVKLELSKTPTCIKAENDGTANRVALGQTRVFGKPRDLGLNHQYLTQYVKSLETETVSMKLFPKAISEVIVFDSFRYQHLLMPLRD